MVKSNRAIAIIWYFSIYPATAHIDSPVKNSRRNSGPQSRAFGVDLHEEA